MSTAAPHSEFVSSRNVPVPTPEQLPDDPATLKNMILELLATLRAERLDREALQNRLHLLLQRLFGRKSERFDPHQLLLFTEDTQGPNGAAAVPEPTAAAAEAEAEVEVPARKRCRPHGRRRLPEDLPRRPLDHVLSDAERICVCGQTRVDIGTDVSEQLDWQPASYFVWQHRIHKYLCPCCAAKATDEQATVTEAAPVDPTPTDPTTTDPTTAASAATAAGSRPASAGSITSARMRR